MEEVGSPWKIMSHIVSSIIKGLIILAKFSLGYHSVVEFTNNDDDIYFFSFILHVLRYSGFGKLCLVKMTIRLTQFNKIWKMLINIHFYKVCLFFHEN